MFLIDLINIIYSQNSEGLHLLGTSLDSVIDTGGNFFITEEVYGHTRTLITRLLLLKKLKII